MTENSLDDVTRTLQEATLQKQNEQFKIITDSLKAKLDDFSIKIKSKINELESNRRTEGVQRSKDPSRKRAGKLNGSARSEMKARQGIDLRLKARQEKDKILTRAKQIMIPHIQIKVISVFMQREI